MEMKIKTARMYYIQSIYGNIDFPVDDIMLNDEKCSPKNVENITGFRFHGGELRCYKTGEFLDEGINITQGLPFGITKQEILKLLEIDEMNKLGRSIKSDSHVIIKNLKLNPDSEIFIP